MTIANVQFADAPGADGQSHAVSAAIDGQEYHAIYLAAPGFLANLVTAWIAAGNVPAPYVAPPSPAVTCALWQLQSVMTSAQWSAVQNFIMEMNNPAVSAFFAHGTNQIPSNSTTLAQIGESIGLTSDQIIALVTQATAVAIP